MRQARELQRLFFRRFLENDLICVDGDTRGTLIGIVSLLVAPGIFMPFLEFLQFGSAPLCFLPWYDRDWVAFPDKVLHIALSMTVLGLITVFEWDAILPDRRDVAVLRPLPISLGTLFGAKLAALFQFWLIFTVAIDGLSCILFPAAVLQNSTLDLLFWHIRSHTLAVLGANAFVFLTMIAVQGALMSVLGYARFRRVAPYVQFLMIALLLGLFFLSIGIAWGVNRHMEPTEVVDLLPAYWFAGFGQSQVGWHTPFFDHLAGHAPSALLWALLAAAVAYALSYRRAVARSFEEQDSPLLQPGPVSRALASLMNRLVVRTPAQRAAFYFVRHTVSRSRTHRLLLAAWAALGFALILQGILGAVARGLADWWADPAGPLLVAPIVLPLFVIMGLRSAISVPAELRGNWLFQVAGNHRPEEYQTGVRRAARLLTLVPVFAVLAPLMAAAWGWRAGLQHSLFGLVIAHLVLEAQLLGLEKLPFTCSFVPGKAELKTRWLLYVLAYVAYTGILSWAGLLLLKYPSWLPAFFCCAAAAQAAIEYLRRRQRTLEVPLVFDERLEPAVQTLELRG